jgi:hypothetical protein
MKPGDRLHGFTVHSIDELSEYHGYGIRVFHDVTGMDVYHLRNEDPENLFAFGFKTPPSDNTGVAHILEHTVLSGSKRYPVKDPFLALMRGSVNTFLNAMTYPDKTLYPAATTVRRDYFNLLAVYGDAVFFPLLKRELFLQEGRRFVPVDGGAVSVEGIVFNEMKGNYSSFESVAGDWSYRSLFEKSEYRFDSGGDPRYIPELSYEDFVEFHHSYYHPSNCRLFLYGNIPTEDQLEFIQERFLSEFTRGERAPDVAEEPRWSAPRELTVRGPSADSEEGKAKPAVLVNWLTGRTTDPLTLLSLQVLEGILIGHPGTPLQKLIDDTDLGEDMAPSSGLESDLRDITFTLGIRGILPEKAKDFERLILEELRRLADEGLPGDVVEGTLRRVEFRNREIRGGSPFGLRLMGKAFKGWIHGTEPRTTLEFSPHMEELKRKYRNEPGFFEKLLREYFVENPHRCLVTVLPDPAYLQDFEQSIHEKVRDIVEKMDEFEREKLHGDLEAFSEFQAAPDTPAALASIPILTRKDLPEDISVIETEEEELSGHPAFSHELFTNGIIYVDFVFNLSGLSSRERRLLPLFSRLISSPGLPGMSYDEVSRQLNLRTGGFYPHIEVSPVVGSPEDIRCFLFFRMKALPDTLEGALELSSRIMRDARLDEKKRLKDVLTEFRNDMKSEIIPAGHSFSVLRAGANLSPVIRIEEEMRGIEQLLFLDSIDLEDEGVTERLGRELTDLRDRVISSERLLLNIGAEPEAMKDARKTVAEYTGFFNGPGERGKLALVPYRGAAGEELRPPGKEWESLKIPAAVGYTGMALPGKLYGSTGYAHHMLVSHLLKTDFLWQKIRMQGGAYGVAASSHGLEGVFSFLSYRDPHVDTSLKVYSEALEYLAEEGVTEDDLEKAIIAVVGKDTRPKSPAEKNIVGLKRKLYGISDELRRQTRHELLAARPDSIRVAAGELQQGLRYASRVVLADDEKLDQAEKLFGIDKADRLAVPM